MKKKCLLITGGTGGHVVPANNLANYLLKKNLNCNIIVDKRGFKYINNFIGKVHIINSSNLYGNFISKVIGSLNLFIGFLQSFFVILILKPKIVISFGSYASFFPMLSCILLKPFYRIDIYIHEQNSVLGRTNKFFINFVNKLFLNFDTKSSLNQKYHHKTFIVGSPERNKVNNKLNKIKKNNKKFTIFIFGGSQGSQYITDFSIKLIKKINKENIINAKFIMQCPKNMKKIISDELNTIDPTIIIKEYYHNIEEILNNSSVVISRAGAGSINDIINFKLPSILIPLPTAKDNHQFHNASILSNHEVSIIVDQNINEIDKEKKYIYEIHNDIKKIELNNNKFDKIKVKNSNSLIYKLVCNE